MWTHARRMGVCTSCIYGKDFGIWTSSWPPFFCSTLNFSQTLSPRCNENWLDTHKALGLRTWKPDICLKHWPCTFVHFVPLDSFPGHPWIPNRTISPSSSGVSASKSLVVRCTGLMQSQSLWLPNKSLRSSWQYAWSSDCCARFDGFDGFGCACCLWMMSFTRVHTCP